MIVNQWSGEQRDNFINDLSVSLASGQVLSAELLKLCYVFCLFCCYQKETIVYHIIQTKMVHLVEASGLPSSIIRYKWNLFLSLMLVFPIMWDFICDFIFYECRNLACNKFSQNVPHSLTLRKNLRQLLIVFPDTAYFTGYYSWFIL